MFHRSPAVPLFHPLLKYLERFHSMLIDSRLIPIYVLDGAQESIKEGTRIEREGRRAKVYEELLKRWTPSTCNDEDYDEASVLSLKKQCTWVRPDIFQSIILILKKLRASYIVAPGQADAQLVSLQTNKIVDCILTNDSDILFLGGNNVIMDFQWDRTCNLVNQEHVKSVMLKHCGDHHAREILSECSIDSVEFASLRAVFATFMGNDFVKTTPKTNSITKDTLFQYFVAASSDTAKKDVIISAATQEVTEGIEQEDGATGQKRKRKDEPRKPTALNKTFLKSFIHSFNWFLFAPVYSFTFPEQMSYRFLEERIIDGTYECDLTPLNKLDSRNDFTLSMIDSNWAFAFLDTIVVANRWERLIGFDMAKVIKDKFSEKNVGKTMPKYNAFAKCLYYARNGAPFESLALPKAKAKDGKRLLPYGALVDFSVIPPKRWDLCTLYDYCRHRDLHVTNKSLSEVVEIVNRAESLEVPIRSVDNSDDYPPDYNTLDNIVVNGAVHLKPFDDSIFKLLREEIPTIDQYFIQEAYGNGPKNELTRANLRVTGGSYQPSSLQYAQGEGTYYGAPKSFIFLDVVCTPSQKLSDVWNIRMVFEKDRGADSSIKYKWAKGPDSKCFCPNGLFCCSHTIGFFMLLAQIQRTSITVEDFKKFALPDNIRSVMQAHPSFNIITHCINTKRKEKKESFEEEEAATDE